MRTMKMGHLYLMKVFNTISLSSNLVTGVGTHKPSPQDLLMCTYLSFVTTH